MDRETMIEICDQILDLANSYKNSISILDKRGIVGYVIKTSSGGTITSRKIDNALDDDEDSYVYEVERSLQPSIYDEKTMKEIMDSVVINEMCEIEQMQAMRWQDYFHERIKKLKETLKIIANNIYADEK